MSEADETGLAPREETESQVPAEAAEPKSPVSLLADVPLQVEVRLGKAEVPVREVLELTPGSVMPLGKGPEEAVDLVVGGQVIARAELVIVENSLGARITEICERPAGGES